MYTIKISEFEILDGEQKIARINVVQNGGIALKVLSGEKTNWTSLTAAIKQVIELIDKNVDALD